MTLPFIQIEIANACHKRGRGQEWERVRLTCAGLARRPRRRGSALLARSEWEGATSLSPEARVRTLTWVASGSAVFFRTVPRNTGFFFERRPRSVWPLSSGASAVACLFRATAVVYTRLRNGARTHSRWLPHASTICRVRALPRSQIDLPAFSPSCSNLRGGKRVFDKVLIANRGEIA